MKLARRGSPPPGWRARLVGVAPVRSGFLRRSGASSWRCHQGASFTKSTPAERDFVREETERLLKSGAVRVARPGEATHVSCNLNEIRVFWQSLPFLTAYRVALAKMATEREARPCTHCRHRRAAGALLLRRSGEPRNSRCRRGLHRTARWRAGNAFARAAVQRGA